MHYLRIKFRLCKQGLEVIFRIGIAILQLNLEDLLALDMEEMIKVNVMPSFFNKKFLLLLAADFLGTCSLLSCCTVKYAVHVNECLLACSFCRTTRNGTTCLL
jgi:hypothetical protein